ncbi:serpentine type 7TM GPCR chemoreceptor srh domain-containing protein [Ditylenchus destructor]|uniref:Serpentine type 7TM GPCR chemoreceptor srh domain-containing protein n=1 Tax=Ditylenchus destructor TaxID=166010 RepID=A0AAD4MK14_9BILA|nr:serpentine type 7TM GPCR chemoreceptor srh domain-containing protein [Ditylenchus destructor]
MELNSVYDILAFIMSLASIIFQFYVIFVVIKVSPFTMRPYRYFLCIMTIWDIIFTFLIGVGLAPHHVYPMSGATVHGFSQDFGLDFAHVMVCAVVFSAVQIMAAEFYCLLYRLTVVFQNRKVHKIFMHPISKVFAQILFVCIGLFFSVPTFHLYLDKEGVVISQTSWINFAAQSLHYTIELHDNSIILLINLDTTFFTAAKVICCCLCAFSVICLLIIFAILRALRKNAHTFSKKTYKIHLQLTILLIVQLICPVVFVILPTGVSLIFALSGYFTPQGFGVVLGHVFMIAISFYGTANSILTMFFVKPYRRHTKSLLQKILCPFIKPQSRIADYDHTVNANAAVNLRNKAKLIFIIRY